MVSIPGWQSQSPEEHHLILQALHRFGELADVAIAVRAIPLLASKR
jgi:hypothetical protein